MTNKIDTPSAMAERIRHLETELKKLSAKPSDNSVIGKLSILERTVNQLYLNRQSANPYRWQAWIPTLTGWSITGSEIARYCLVGKLCFFEIYISGTSDNTATEVSLPFTAATIANFNWSGASATSIDSGTISTTGGRWAIGSAGTSIIFFSDMASAAWTASGTKTIRAQGFYEVA